MGSEVKMAVGTCIVTLALHGNGSLKGKRSVVNRIKDRVRNRFNVSIAEVGDMDRVQRAVLGLASVSNDRVYLEGQFAKAVDFMAGLTGAEIAGVRTFIELKGSDDHVFFQKGR